MAFSKKIRYRLYFFLVMVGCTTVIASSSYLRFQLFCLIDYPFHYKEYKVFGIRIPTQYAVHGIDVSKWQSKIDWKRVKSMQVDDIQISFVFMKATEGSNRKDPSFSKNWEEAKKQHLIRGAYHYFWPQISPKVQADLFMKEVKLKSGDLPPVIDVEECRNVSREQIVKGTQLFCSLLEKRYGKRPIIYTNRDFYKNYFADNAAFKNYVFWVAHYHVTELALPDEKVWHFWQHSDRGKVSGIAEKVDFNVFKGNLDELKMLCLK